SYRVFAFGDRLNHDSCSVATLGLAVPRSLRLINTSQTACRIFSAFPLDTPGQPRYKAPALVLERRLRMYSRMLLIALSMGGFVPALCGFALPHGQDAATSGGAPSDLPPVPKGVEVLARGPVHEAFATPTTEPAPTKAVAKKPPKPLDELPPEEKPEG